MANGLQSMIAAAGRKVQMPHFCRPLSIQQFVVMRQRQVALCFCFSLRLACNSFDLRSWLFCASKWVHILNYSNWQQSAHSKA
eukprot:1139683-Pelagomonas_calceolata.AAC.3